MLGVTMPLCMHPLRLLDRAWHLTMNWYLSILVSSSAQTSSWGMKIWTYSPPEMIKVPDHYKENSAEVLCT